MPKRMIFIRKGFIISLLVFGLIILFNQITTAQTTPTPDVGNCPLPLVKTVDGKLIEILAFSGIIKDDGTVLKPGDLKTVLLEDRIKVQVSNLSEAVKQDPRFAEKLVLNLDGYALKGLHGTYVPPDQLIFQLTHLNESHNEWNAILGNIFNKEKIVTVAVGCPNGQVIAKSKEVNNSLTIRLWQSWRGFVIFVPLLLLIGFWWVGLPGSVLRNSGISPKRAYSLGRSQLALWSYLIFGSFLVIFAVTGDFNNILTPQSLILLGISGVTTLGASILDNTPEKQLTDQEKLDLQKYLDEYNQPNTTPAQKEVLVKSMNRLEQQSQDFFKDILTDPQGQVNLHRFQMLIWTVILGGIFLYEVVINFELPEFGETLLALSGISSSTYLALKSTEKKPEG